MAKKRWKAKGKQSTVAESLISTTSEPADKLGLERTARMHGLTLEQSKDSRSRSAFGRLYVKSVISIHQYDALEAMQHLHGEYLKAIAAPGRPKTTGEGSGAVISDDQYAAWVNQTKKRYRSAVDDIHTAERFIRMQLWDAFSLWVLSDSEADHRREDLIACANILMLHFGIDRRSKAA